MAVAGSGLYVLTFRDSLNATQMALDLTSTSNKWALFTNTVTPNYNTDTAYGTAPYNANEVTGTGYTAGGVAVASPTLTASAGGILTYDQADLSWANSTLTGVRCALLYANALTPKAAVCLVDFGQDYATSNGTLAVNWNAAGVFTLDLVP